MYARCYPFLHQKPLPRPLWPPVRNTPEHAFGESQLSPATCTVRAVPIATTAVPASVSTSISPSGTSSTASPIESWHVGAFCCNLKEL